MTPPQSGGTPGSTKPLSRLVKEHLESSGQSLRELAERCHEPQGDRTLLHSWIDQLAHGRMARAPELWRLRALAVGMGVPLQVLTELAANQWLGVEVAAVFVDQKYRVVVTVPESMTPEKRVRFVKMVEYMARHMEE
jgi:hypothetical protein